MNLFAIKRKEIVYFIKKKIKTTIAADNVLDVCNHVQDSFPGSFDYYNI